MATDEHLGIPRLMWESDHEWHARVAFIDSNKEYYSGDQLGSFSMAWSNWKFMGVTYGLEVQGWLVFVCQFRGRRQLVFVTLNGKLAVKGGGGRQHGR